VAKDRGKYISETKPRAPRGYRTDEDTKAEEPAPLIMGEEPSDERKVTAFLVSFPNLEGQPYSRRPYYVYNWLQAVRVTAKRHGGKVSAGDQIVSVAFGSAGAAKDFVDRLVHSHHVPQHRIEAVVDHSVEKTSGKYMLLSDLPDKYKVKGMSVNVRGIEATLHRLNGKPGFVQILSEVGPIWASEYDVRVRVAEVRDPAIHQAILNGVAAGLADGAQVDEKIMNAAKDLVEELEQSNGSSVEEMFFRSNENGSVEEAVEYGMQLGVNSFWSDGEGF
jgi:hypothetical protein